MISKSIDHLIAQQFYFVICLWSLLVIWTVHQCVKLHTDVLNCSNTAWPHILKKPSDCKVSGFWIEAIAQTHTYTKYTDYTLPSRGNSDMPTFKMKLQSDTAEKFPWSTAAASWERHLFSSQPEKGENILPHTSSLIDSKNSSVNLSGKWDSSDSAVAGEGCWKRGGGVNWDLVLVIMFYSIYFTYLFFHWPHHHTWLNVCNNTDELNIPFTFMHIVYLSTATRLKTLSVLLKYWTIYNRRKGIILNGGWHLTFFTTDCQPVGHYHYNFHWLQVLWKITWT